MLPRFFKQQKKTYLIRFSYRKCLTHFMGAVFDKNKHYFVRQRKLFVEHLERQKPQRFISTNNNLFYPGRKIFQNARMIHLMRHPKDIIISGYFYHKKGSELWTKEEITMPRLYTLSYELDHILNEQEKKLIYPGVTFKKLLENLPFEKGMMAEMVRLKYFHSFNPVPYYESPIIRTFRFEEIVEDMPGSIQQICQYWQLSEKETAYYAERAAHYAQNPNYQIRDASAFQYKKYYNQALNKFYDQQFHNLAQRLNYPE